MPLLPLFSILQHYLLSPMLQAFPSAPSGTPDWVQALGYLLLVIAFVIGSVTAFIQAYLKPRLDRAEEKAEKAKAQVDLTTTKLTQDSTVVKAKVEAQASEFDLYKAQINFLWDRVTTLESSRTMDQQRYDKMLNLLRDVQLDYEKAKGRIAELERELKAANARVAELETECNQNRDDLEAFKAAAEEIGGPDLTRKIQFRTHRRRADRTDKQDVETK